MMSGTSPDRDPFTQAWHRVTLPRYARRGLASTLPHEDDYVRRRYVDHAATIARRHFLVASPEGDSVVREQCADEFDRDRVPAQGPVVSGEVDAGLVEALRRGDVDAAEQLVERYGERVYRLTLAITGMKDAAEEAVVEALSTAARTVHTFTGHSPFASWLDRISASAAYRALMRTRPPQADDIAMDDLLPSLDRDGRHFAPMNDWSSQIDGRAPQDELQQVVAAAIAALPPDYRAALVLHDVQGLSNADVAEALDMSPATTTSRVHRSRLFVRQRLSEYLKSA
jgi:RNA polymerase sigma-70 factor, ECF subfamily